MNVPTEDARTPREDLIPRSYPEAMLMPFFPEPTGAREYKTTLSGSDVKIYVEGAGDTIATPGDRRLISILSAALARQIRNGIISRHIDITLPEIIHATGGPRQLGGEDYMRLREKLTRLMATVIETSEPIAGGLVRNKRFRWVDMFEYDSTDRTITGNTKSIKISLSQEAFKIMAESLGFDTPHDAFMSVTANPSATWRIYEICLASILNNGRRPTFVPMGELHQRIPLQCTLKLFKGRALKKAFDTIAEHPEMSRRIRLKLVRKTADGHQEIDFSHRCPSGDVMIGIFPVDLSDIQPDRLVGPPNTDEEADLM